MNTGRKGFTLIEILIVVAIIAILSSVVLVGLGPTQQSGRDARRLSDLRQTQNSLALYYNKCGIYPGTNACAAGSPGATWSAFSTTVVGSGIGITNALPVDPSSGRTYTYAYVTANNSNYIVGAVLENAANAAFNGYQAPSLTGYTSVPATGITNCAAASTYCAGL